MSDTEQYSANESMNDTLNDSVEDAELEAIKVRSSNSHHLLIF